MYEEIVTLSQKFLRIKNSSYRRYFIRSQKLKQRLSIIVGQRGVGKTTTLVQVLLDNVGGDILDPRILYVQVDHFQMGTSSMYEIAEQFHSLGGKWIAFDEIHKYPEWSKELKSITDTFPDLQVIASGSSALEIYRGTHDLTRRAVCYHMQGLSFREFLELSHDLKLEVLDLESILKTHPECTENVIFALASKELKILPEFYRYLEEGYYPYFAELNDVAVYHQTLEQNLHTTIESDLVALYPDLTGSSIKKIKQLMIFIANAVPFIPNWNKVKSALEVGDMRTVKNYFKHLEDADLIRELAKATDKFSQIESTCKVYLDNPNQLYAISKHLPDRGTVRETFFLSMLAKDHEVQAPQRGDFLVDGKYVFEVGGKKKAFTQIKNIKNSYLACDEIERGAQSKIPLWLFGFLY